MCIRDRKWTSNGDIVATVGEIRTNTTAGTLGDYDICIAGSGLSLIHI